MIINFKIYEISQDINKLAGHHVKLKKKKHSSTGSGYFLCTALT